jgi:hypothetical protein
MMEVGQQPSDLVELRRPSEPILLGEAREADLLDADAAGVQAADVVEELGRVAELADVAVGVDDVVRAEPVRLARLHPEVHDAFDLGDTGGVVAFCVVQDDADGRHGAVRERARGGVERDRRFMDRR